MQLQQRQTATRRFPRVAAQHVCMIRVLGGMRPFEEFARTQVIGPGGCMFVSPESLGFGSLMELSISMKGRVLRTDGRVVYEIQKGTNEHQVGVEFLRISPSDKMFIEGVVAQRSANDAQPVARRA